MHSVACSCVVGAGPAPDSQTPCWLSAPGLGSCCNPLFEHCLGVSGLAWKAPVTGRKAPLFRTGPQWNERPVKPPRGSWDRGHIGELTGSSVPRNQVFSLSWVLRSGPLVLKYPLQHRAVVSFPCSSGNLRDCYLLSADSHLARRLLQLPQCSSLSQTPPTAGSHLLLSLCSAWVCVSDCSSESAGSLISGLL